MIKIKPDQRSILDLFVSTRGLAVFLDQWAIKELAKRDPERRKRFVAAIHRGADILFSVTNAAELTGPQGVSWEEMRAFLNELGPCWFPVELDAYEVTKREAQGMPPDKSCFCDRFLKDYVASYCGSAPPGKIIGISEETFALGHIMKWLAPQRDSITRGKRELDEALIRRITGYRAESDADPSWLDRTFPVLPFHPKMAATFTYINLVRLLVKESKAFAMTPGDGIDFCQAVIGSAFASFVTLDRKWKRRVEMLPKPNSLAKVYYEPELDAMVDDLETASVALERKTASLISPSSVAGSSLRD